MFERFDNLFNVDNRQRLRSSSVDSNFDHFEQLMELSLGRVPALETAGIKELVNGPESFTPDGNFIIGEAPELKNFFVGAGFHRYFAHRAFKTSRTFQFVLGFFGVMGFQRGPL